MQSSDRLTNLLEVYRPFFFENLSGIAAIASNKLLLCDRGKGLLTEVDIESNTEAFSKKYNINDYAQINSISYYNDFLYSIYKNQIYVAKYHFQKDSLEPDLLTQFSFEEELTGIAVSHEKIYLVTKSKNIFSYNQETKEVEMLGCSLGVSSLDDLCYFQGNLLIVDSQEQTIHVFDLEKREIIYEILTPFENPTAIAAVYKEKLGKDVLYVAYSRASFEVYDTGDSDFELEIDTAVRDNFIYPLVYRCDRDKKAVLSNGFLVEMSYVKKLHALPEVAQEYRQFKNLDWKISLPIDTDRQKLLSIKPIGSFSTKIEEVIEDNRKIMVFSIPELNIPTDRKVFGWKALIEMSGIRYFCQEKEVREISEEELHRYSKYLQNEPKLDMDKSSVIQAARKAIKNLPDDQKNNILAKTKAIRKYICENITYEINAYNEGSEEVLTRGKGSCGEYLNVFLALMRLNKIPARRCGNYKVPGYKMQPGARSQFLSPDFERVWLQFYVPDLGWVPLESTADDKTSSFQDWAKRYFMALAWYHCECRIEGYFEDIFEQGSEQSFFLSTDELSIKDIKFKVIGELDLK